MTNYIAIGATLASAPLEVTGIAKATNFQTTSDYRIKENIEPLDLKLFNTNKLNPITYYNKVLEKEDIGFIAHEVQDSLPLLVSGEKNGLINQTINYTGLIPILVKEIQDLKQRVTYLETKLEK